MTKTGRIVRATFFTLAFLLAVGAAGYYAWRFYDLQQHPEKLTTESTIALKTAVAKLILLPDEEPQIVTVQDVEKLKKEQPFFLNAQNGDKILIYQKAKKALLYRPNEHRLIEVGPITLPEGTTSGPASSSNTTQSPTIPTTSGVSQPTSDQSTTIPTTSSPATNRTSP